MLVTLIEYCLNWFTQRTYVINEGSPCGERGGEIRVEGEGLDAMWLAGSTNLLYVAAWLMRLCVSMGVVS